jgi:peptide/nickel transport system permease protein
MTLRNYVIRRLLLTAVTLCGVVLAVFVLTHVLPGNPALVKLGAYASPERLAALEKEMGLDKPAPVQFANYAWNLVHGNMGNSWRTGHPVTSDILQRLPATIELAMAAFLLSLIVAIPLGVIAAVKRDTLFDRFVQAIAVLGAATPLFWLGLILIFFLYHQLGWAPAPMGRIDTFVTPPQTITGLYTLDSILTGNWQAFSSSFQHLLLPMLSLAVVEIAPLTKIARSTMASVLQSDYVMGAKAIGLSQRQIIWQDAFKNAMVSILTMMGIVFGYLLAGNVVIEMIFAWPGIGQYVWNALMSNDYDAVQGFVLTIAIIYLFLNLIIDLLYSVIDPRIRLGSSS